MKAIRQLLLIIIGFILISVLPVLFYGGGNAELYYLMMNDQGNSFGFYPKEYFLGIYHVFTRIIQQDQWILFVLGKEYQLQGVLAERYFYSMKVFLFSLGLAVGISFLVSLFISLSSKWMQNAFLSLVNILESLPDVFIIIGIQLTVVMYFRHTGVLIGEIAMTDEELYLLPVTCLTIVPTVFLIKTIVLLLEEEDQKSYIELARGKGLNAFQVLVTHAIRNVVYSLFYRSKIIFSFMLSNLFILERLFNMRGIMDLLIWSSGFTFVIISTVIFLPFFLVLTLIEMRMKKSIGLKEDGTYV
ncbi:MAG: ABC transporter permease subunit [Bacillota bacterium]